MKFVLLWDTNHTLPASQNDLAIVMLCIASWGMSNGFKSSLGSTLSGLNGLAPVGQVSHCRTHR